MKGPDYTLQGIKFTALSELSFEESTLVAWHCHYFVVKGLDMLGGCRVEPGARDIIHST